MTKHSSSYEPKNVFDLGTIYVMSPRSKLTYNYFTYKIILFFNENRMRLLFAEVYLILSFISEMTIRKFE